MGKLLRFLVLACVVQAAGAQSLFKGFIPDEGGTNLDAPIQRQTVASGTIIKDCSQCPEMVVLPSGNFLMGSQNDPLSDLIPRSPDEQPRHLVNIQSFAIGKYEVTQEQWYVVMGSNPSYNKGRDLPVEQVSWDDVQEFISKLSHDTGRKYRLPSESEWEFAARAGTATDWSFGNDESKLGNYAWHRGNSAYKTQPVGGKLPNAFGLFDMHGNVWEWTQDCWHVNYAGAPTDGSAWTTDCTGNYRVLRGDSCVNNFSSLRSAGRCRNGPGRRVSNYGFRLARDL